MLIVGTDENQADSPDATATVIIKVSIPSSLEMDMRVEIEMDLPIVFTDNQNVGYARFFCSVRSLD